LFGAGRGNMTKSKACLKSMEKKSSQTTVSKQRPTQERRRIYIHTCVYVYMYICICLYMYIIYICILCIYVYMYIIESAYMCILVYTYMFLFAHGQV